MASDPAFLFYPGDYLRDTQCLSEPVQVAYDRIMCEHMRNICITQAQLNFFTKRLSGEEKKELEFVLTKIDGGFQIKWVAESITKRRSYSKSRSENRTKKPKNISSTYDEHMDNEIEIVNEIVIKEEKAIPSKDEFLQYCQERCLGQGFNWVEYKQGASTKYDAWRENGWKDLKGNKIGNWKSKVINNLEYFKTKINGSEKLGTSDARLQALAALK